MGLLIKKSSGVTNTERLLAAFCERSFLKLWSYPNPYKDDGHELCDLIAVFGNSIFIFFDRNSELPYESDKDPQVLWDRWKNNVIDRQVNTAHGAERYIRAAKAIYLDSKKTIPFPLKIDLKHAIIHKIIVAHGAKTACENASIHNIYGSLAISYGNFVGNSQQFHIDIDKDKPVHIFDSHNLPILLTELDTVTDFSAYLKEKIRAITTFDYLSYCGEEDLLAHYLLNYDEKLNAHVIGPKDDCDKLNGILIGEGEWHDFIDTEIYKNTKKENRISYFWDELIQRTCQNAIDGTLISNSDLLHGKSAIFEMVKEPRFVRRALANTMLKAVERFPDESHKIMRQVTFLPSFQKNIGYVFLQLHVPISSKPKDDYREKRQILLEIACAAAKNKFSHLIKVIGIGIDAPKFAGDINSEDFILLECESWSEETRSHYDKLNKDWNFFNTSALHQYNDRITQFVLPKN